MNKIISRQVKLHDVNNNDGLQPLICLPSRRWPGPRTHPPRATPPANPSGPPASQRASPPDKARVVPQRPARRPGTSDPPRTSEPAEARPSAASREPPLLLGPALQNPSAAPPRQNPSAARWEAMHGGAGGVGCGCEGLRREDADAILWCGRGGLASCAVGECMVLREPRRRDRGR
jgi:hypothetical protein